MLFAKSTLPADVRMFINKLMQLDLEPIAYRVMNSNEEQLSLKETNQLLSYYLMFLLLIYLYPNSQIIPSKEIDRVWHYHITDTIKYAEDCEMLFGKFIHHFPYFGKRGEIDRVNLQTAFEQTQVLFQEHFGTTMDISNKPSVAADCQPIGRITQLVRPRVEIGELFCIKHLFG